MKARDDYESKGNVHTGCRWRETMGMELREGKGNVYERGQPMEGDELNVVWVVDSDKLPFYR
jgi:hypothetical protein